MSSSSSSSSRERERERERETSVKSIDITLKSRIWLPRRLETLRVDAFWTSEPVECSSACEDKELGTWALEQQRRVIVVWRSESVSFAFADQPAVDHPSAFRWRASSKKNRPSSCLFPFRMATILPFRTAWIADILSQASLRDEQRQRCWKRGSGDGQRLSLWDYGTTERVFNAVRRSPEPSARPSAAANSEERQIRTTCLFAESVEMCWCFLPSCAMYIDNAVGNVVAEAGRDLVFMTARLSDLSMPLKGEVRRSPEQSARQPIARSGKFVRLAYSWRALDCEKVTVLCFHPSLNTLLFERGWEEWRFDVADRSETPKPRRQSHKQQLLRPRSGPSRAAHPRTIHGERTASTEQISKKGIKLIPKTIGNRKGDCAWSSIWQTQPEKICKLQSTKISTMCGVNDTDLCFAICRFSQFLFVTSNNFRHNLLFYLQ